MGKKEKAVIILLAIAAAALSIILFLSLSRDLATPVSESVTTPTSSNAELTFVHLAKNITTSEQLFSDSVRAVSGDSLEFMIKISVMEGEVKDPNIIIDSSSYLEIVPGSITIDGSLVENIFPIDPLQGLSIGDLTTGDEKTVIYRAVLAEGSFYTFDTIQITSQILFNNGREEASVKITDSRM